MNKLMNKIIAGALLLIAFVSIGLKSFACVTMGEGGVYTVDSSGSILLSDQPKEKNVSK